jgi:hypothetical protein
LSVRRSAAWRAGYLFGASLHLGKKLVDANRPDRGREYKLIVQLNFSLNGTKASELILGCFEKELSLMGSALTVEQSRLLREVRSFSTSTASWLSA